HPFAGRASRKTQPTEGVAAELAAAGGADLPGFGLAPRAAHRRRLDRGLGRAAGSLRAVRPVGQMHLRDEIGQTVALHRADLGQFLIHEGELAAIEPEAAATPATMQIDIGLVEKTDAVQVGVVAARALQNLTRRLLHLFLRAELDAPRNLIGDAVEFTRIQPEAAALLAHVVGEQPLRRAHAVAGQLGAAVQAAHRAPVYIG